VEDLSLPAAVVCFMMLTIGVRRDAFFLLLVCQLLDFKTDIWRSWVSCNALSTIYAVSLCVKERTNERPKVYQKRMRPIYRLHLSDAKSLSRYRMIKTIV